MAFTSRRGSDILLTAAAANPERSAGELDKIADFLQVGKFCSRQDASQEVRLAYAGVVCIVNMRYPCAKVTVWRIGCTCCFVA